MSCRVASGRSADHRSSSPSANENSGGAAATLAALTASTSATGAPDPPRIWSITRCGTVCPTGALLHRCFPRSGGGAPEPGQPEEPKA
eukprot:10774306-Alexandrium_andersonii.AAC.1